MQHLGWLNTTVMQILKMEIKTQRTGMLDFCKMLLRSSISVCTCLRIQHVRYVNAAECIVDVLILRDMIVLVVRDEFSGFIRAFPLGSRSSENINKHLLAFLGPSYHKQPSIMVKSDQAHEFQASCSQLGFQHEPTLEGRWPHNARLERELRTLEEITRAVHLQAGFHMFQDLW